MRVSRSLMYYLLSKNKNTCSHTPMPNYAWHPPGSGPGPAPPYPHPPRFLRPATRPDSAVGSGNPPDPRPGRVWGPDGYPATRDEHIGGAGSCNAVAVLRSVTGGGGRGSCDQRQRSVVLGGGRRGASRTRPCGGAGRQGVVTRDRKSTRLNSSHPV